MTHEYDKIIKENILPSITTLLQKTIGVQIVKYEVVYPELTYTVDKEADFILLATDINGVQKLYHIEFQVKNDTNITESDLLLMRYHKQAQSLGKLRKLNAIISNLSKTMLSEIFEPLTIEEEPAYLLGELKGEARGEEKTITKTVHAMFVQKLDLGLIVAIMGIPLTTIQEMHKEWQKSQK